MDGFAYWIFGYQKFAETIIRECICLKKGWQDVMGKVTTPTIDEILRSLESRKDWDNDFQGLKQCAKNCLSKRKQRMALDAAFLDENEAPVVGEFKSWGGFETFSETRLYDEVISGKLFPDRLAIDKIYYKSHPLNVSKFVIATSLSSQNNEDIIWKIGNLTIEVFDIADLLREYGEQAAQNRGSLEQLEQSVETVKKYIRTGKTGDEQGTISKISEEERSGRIEKYENEQLRIFVDDDDGYLSWVRENFVGYVVNSHRKPISGHTRLHRAKCGTIRNPTRGPGNWTTKEYVKICSLDKNELKKWVEKKVGGTLRNCQVCKP